MVSATGIGSGLDIEALVTQLVAAERAPTENRLLRREASLTSELSAFGTFKGALGTFQNSLSALNTLATFTQRSATSSDSAVVTATATSDAAAASYSVEVDQLATAQSLASGSFSSLTETVGEGTLTLRFGTTDYTPPSSYDGFVVNPERESVTISINNSNNTVQGVADAINNADAGVSAVVVNDQGDYRLLISSDQTGADNSVEIVVDDTGDGDDEDAAGLSRLAFNDSADNLSQTVAAQDAQFRINGLLLGSDSNTPDDVIDGVNLAFNGTSSGSPVTVTVSENRDAVREAITSFVDAYNSFISTANSLTSYNAETGAAGALQGDFSARSVIAKVRNGVTGAAQGYQGPFTTIAEIGITTTASGTLEINDDRLDAALADNFDSVAGIFTQAASASSAGLTVRGTTAATQLGSYEVVVTSIGTQGSLQGVDITPLTNQKRRIDGGNETLGLSIDGIERTFNITRGFYSSFEDIAAVIEADANTVFAGTGVSVSVEFANNGYLITSQSLGSGSTVEIIDVDARTDVELGLFLGPGSPGIDTLAGTIGGQPATVEGSVLVGAVGSPAEGLRVDVGSPGLGSLGIITVSQGIISPLDSILGGYLDSGGILDARTEGLQSGVDRVADDREALNRRLEALEARYRRQFNALDVLLSQLQNTGSFVADQLANIPLPGDFNSNN